MQRYDIPKADLTLKNNPDECEEHIRPISCRFEQKAKNGGTHEHTAAEQRSTAI